MSDDLYRLTIVNSQVTAYDELDDGVWKPEDMSPRKSFTFNTDGTVTLEEIEYGYTSILILLPTDTAGIYSEGQEVYRLTDGSIVTIEPGEVEDFDDDDGDGYDDDDRDQDGLDDDDIECGDDDDHEDGGQGDDDISGNSGNDTINGGAGDDSIDGGVGDDSVLGGQNDDNLGGGMDDDSVSGGGGNDSIGGASGDDSLEGDAGRDYLNGGSGDDCFEDGNGSGRDRYVGGNGVDTVDYSAATQSVTVTLVDGTATGTTIGTDALALIENIIGGSAGDVLTGNGRENRIAGGAGADTLNGGAGDDSLYGGADDDVLRGGSGDDKLVGGFGADTFAFALGDGEAKILDFTDGEDMIRFSGAADSFDDLSIFQKGEDTIIRYMDLKIELEDTTAATLSDADFIFA